MGQYWKLFKLSKGVYSRCGASKLWEFSGWTSMHVRFGQLLRPGGKWHGDRVVFSGDYSENRDHVLLYLAARGLPLPTDDGETADNLYHLADTFPEEKLFEDSDDEVAYAEEADFFATIQEQKACGVSIDRKQCIRLDNTASWIAFISLLSEASGAGSGDVKSPFRGDWAADHAAILPAEELGEYEDISARLLTPHWLSYVERNL